MTEEEYKKSEGLTRFVDYTKMDLPLFQRVVYQTAVVQRDKAMQQVSANTSAEFRACAEQAIVSVGRLNKTFTGDDVWDWIMSKTTIRSHDNRALGPIIKRMSTAKIIEPTGDYSPSRRRHLAPIRVWRLLID